MNIFHERTFPIKIVLCQRAQNFFSGSENFIFIRLNTFHSIYARINSIDLFRRIVYQFFLVILKF